MTSKWCLLALTLLAVGTADAIRYDNQVGGSITVAGTESTVSIVGCNVTFIDIQALAAGATVTITNTHTNAGGDADTTAGLSLPALVGATVVISGSTMKSTGPAVKFGAVDAQSNVTLSASTLRSECSAASNALNCPGHTNAIHFTTSMSGSLVISDDSIVLSIARSSHYVNAMYFQGTVYGYVTITDSSVTAQKNGGSRAYGMLFMDYMRGTLALTNVTQRAMGNAYSSPIRFNRDVRSATISIENCDVTTTAANVVVLFLKTMEWSTLAVSHSVFTITSASLAAGIVFTKLVKTSDVAINDLKIRGVVPTHALGLAVAWSDSNITICNLDPPTYTAPTLTRSALLLTCDPWSTTAEPLTSTPTTPQPAAVTNTTSVPVGATATANPAVVPEAEVQVLSTAAGVGGILGGMADPTLGMQLSRAMSIVVLAECRRNVTARLSFPLSVAPFLGFGNALGFYARGAIVANVVVFILALPAATLVGFVIQRVKGTPSPTYLESLRAVRFPGGLAVVYAFLCGGTALAASSLLHQSESMVVDLPLAVVASAIAATGIVAAVLMVRHCRAGVAYGPAYLGYVGSKEHCAGDPVFGCEKDFKTRAATTLFFGGTAWFPHSEDDDGAAVEKFDHFGILLKRWQAGVVSPYFFAVEATVTVLVSVATGLNQLDCVASAAVVTVLCGLIAALKVVVRPHNVTATYVCSVGADALTFCGAVTILVAVGQSDQPLARVGGRLVLAAGYVYTLSVGLIAVRLVVMWRLKCRMFPCDAGALSALLHFNLDDDDEMRNIAGCRAIEENGAVNTGATGADEDTGRIAVPPGTKPVAIESELL
jgi:hypothetical protein